MAILTALVVILAALGVLLCYRLLMLRRGGTPALLRVDPREADRGWRHGLIRYGESSLTFYKLSSLRVGPDSRISRRGIAVGDRREPHGSEFEIMTAEITVLALSDGERSYEVALDRAALTAFLSWVESRPSVRSRRRRPGLDQRH